MKKWKKRLLIICAGLLAILEGNTYFFRRAQEQTDADPAAESADADRDTKKVALTFDDGPHSVYTPLLLEGLRERGVSASFFLLGQCIRGNEKVVEQMKKDGHLIGNHTFSHKDLTALSEKEAEQEILRAGSAIYEAAGVHTAFVRPPYGRWPEGLELQVTMIPVFWTLDSLDWKLRDADRTAEQVLNQAEPGSVILMHDCYETSVEAAFLVVDGLQDQGYQFVTADELIFP